MGLMRVCLEGAEVFYVRQRKHAVLLRLSAFLVFLPLVSAFFPMALYRLRIDVSPVELWLFVFIFAPISLVSLLWDTFVVARSEWEKREARANELFAYSEKPTAL